VVDRSLDSLIKLRIDELRIVGRGVYGEPYGGPGAPYPPSKPGPPLTLACFRMSSMTAFLRSELSQAACTSCSVALDAQARLWSLEHHKSNLFRRRSSQLHKQKARACVES
jgi:hypothetical protein